MVRGGAYSSADKLIRSSTRFPRAPTTVTDSQGFRCARDDLTSIAPQCDLGVLGWTGAGKKPDTHPRWVDHHPQGGFLASALGHVGTTYYWQVARVRQGKVQWTYTREGTKNGRFAGAAVTPGGNTYLVGRTYKGNAGFNLYEGLLVELDGKGKEIGTYEVKSKYKFTRFTSITRLQDGRMLVGGQNYNSGSSPTCNGGGFWWFGEGRKLLSSAKVAGCYSVFYIDDVDELNDGRLVAGAAGKKQSAGKSIDALFQLYDASGKLLQQTDISTSTNDSDVRVAPINQGTEGFAVAYSTRGTGTAKYKARLVMLKADGKPLWNKEFTPSAGDNLFRDVSWSARAGVVVAGSAAGAGRLWYFEPGKQDIVKTVSSSAGALGSVQALVDGRLIVGAHASSGDLNQVMVADGWLRTSCADSGLCLSRSPASCADAKQCTAGTCPK